MKFIVLQISPAEGWRAVYAVRDSQGEWGVAARPIAVWALVEAEDGYRQVVGLVVWHEMKSLESAEAFDNFLGYLPPGGTLNQYWLEQARAYGRGQVPG